MKAHVARLTPGLLALALVASALAPAGHFFLGNFLTYWVPLSVVLVLSTFAGAASSTLAGAATALAGYLIWYHAWATGGLAWLGYLFAMAGAALGGAIAPAIVGRCKVRSIVSLFWIGLMMTALGLIAATIGVCATVLYCGR